jgi:Iap family predicted aminopeptidase
MVSERTSERRAWERRWPTDAASQYALAKRLEAAGALAVLESSWTGGWGSYRVVHMSRTTQIPSVVLSCEDYGLVHRLTERNQGPRLRLTADGELLGDAPVAYVLAEIRGSEKPNEYVMLSAHFDSWDGGSGATDNGTGTITMLEAMRILKLAYPNPKRTILVGHWSGEEQGLIGSRAWAADHPEVVRGMQALFNQDNGTGRVVNISASGLIDATGSLASWLSRVPRDITRHVNFGFVGGPSGGGSDNASFICYGAPAFSLGSISWDYGTYTWHTNRDTFDKVVFSELRNNATLTAMLAYLASEDPETVSRTRASVFNFRGQPGQWPSCQVPPRKSADWQR